MIFKVLYQEDLNEVPIRENTKTIYYQAESELEVRNALKDRQINIEYIQPLNPEHLEHEKKSVDFVVENAE